MKSWVAAYYPGTKIGVTEYNWGAETNINGGTAQADLLGIFGREGLDLATRWTTPTNTAPAFKAMKMYRNYDGNKSTFGNTSVLDAISTNVDLISSFAAVRSGDGALTVMVINKQLSAIATVTVNLANYSASGTAQVWQLASANTLSRLSDLAVSGNSLNTILPPQSVTLFVIPGITPLPTPTLTGSSMSPPGTFKVTLNGQPGLTYLVQQSADLGSGASGWIPICTNTLSGASTNLAFTSAASAQYFRACWTGY